MSIAFHITSCDANYRKQLNGDFFCNKLPQVIEYSPRASISSKTPKEGGAPIQKRQLLDDLRYCFFKIVELRTV